MQITKRLRSIAALMALLLVSGLPAQATPTSFTVTFTNNLTPDAQGEVAVTFSYSVAQQRINGMAISRTTGVYKNGNTGYPAHSTYQSGVSAGFRSYACPTSFTSADLPITDVNAGLVQGPIARTATLSAPVGCTELSFTNYQGASYDQTTSVAAANAPSVALTNFSSTMSKLVVRAEWFVVQSGSWEALRYAVYGDVATINVPTAPAISTGTLGSAAVTTSNSASWSFQVDQNSTWRAVIMSSTDTAPTATALLGNTIMSFPPSTNGSATANTSTLVHFSSLTAGTYKIYIAAYATAGYNSTVLASPAFTIAMGGGGGGSQIDPPCQANGNNATLAQVGVSRTSFASGESYQTTIGGQPIGSVCTITLNSGFWVRTSINSTVVTVSGTVMTSTVRFSTTTPISYTTFLAGLVNQGYSTAIQNGDVWKREYFTTSNPPTSGDTPVASMTMTLGVSGGSSTPAVTASRSVYVGPQIMAVSTPRPILSGGKLVFTGQNLDAITQATIGAKAATLSFDAKTGLSIGTPAGLAAGKYDLVMQSSFGLFTFINGVSIKAPTPTVNLGFRSDASHLNEKQVLDLVAFNQTLNSDYEKVRCVVNAADPKTAKRIADLVCAQVARGEARNVEVIKDVRNTYSGEGFWVRVYAAG